MILNGLNSSKIQNKIYYHDRHNQNFGYKRALLLTKCKIIKDLKSSVEIKGTKTYEIPAKKIILTISLENLFPFLSEIQ